MEIVVEATAGTGERDEAVGLLAVWKDGDGMFGVLELVEDHEAWEG